MSTSRRGDKRSHPLSSTPEMLRPHSCDVIISSDMASEIPLRGLNASNNNELGMENSDVENPPREDCDDQFDEDAPMVNTSGALNLKRLHSHALRRCSSSSSSSSLSSSSSPSLSSLCGVVKPHGLTRFQEDDATSTEGEDELFSMTTLSGVISPDVLNDVKKRLRHTKYKPREKKLKSTIRSSPAVEWAQKQKLKHKRDLSRQDSALIKAGWKIRQELADLKSTETHALNAFYLETVASGVVRNVKALFTYCKTSSWSNFQPNCVNQHDKGALRLAIENNDLEMCEVLLTNKVRVGDSIFHAIQRNFVGAVEVILKYDLCENLRIKEDNYYFTVGMTPMILAASNNNYDILKLLHQKGHRLKDSLDWWQGIHLAWESAADRQMMCKAKSSPAYITLMSEVNRQNPMKYCLQLIRELRENSELERELSDFYSKQERQIEDYMCSLLDQVQSSEELARLFEYDHVHHRDKSTEPEVIRSRKIICSRMDLLETASKTRLVKFVTHRNSQLALAYMRYRYMAWLRNNNSIKRMFIDRGIGLLFPILSIMYLIAPNSRFGGLLELPNVSFECHLMSDLTFIGILIGNILSRTVENDYLGAPPRVLEWLIFVWILGKWMEEFQECSSRGYRSYFRDWWNYNDILLLLLFAACIILRAVDFTMHVNDRRRHYRDEWHAFEPRLLASGVLAWAYVFVFLRIMGLTRSNRVLGPLQVTLSKMMVNVIQFLCIFSLVLFAFALGLSEVYWYYGTPNGTALICNANGTICPGTMFGNLGLSLSDLFWSLFGQIDLAQLSLNGKHQFVEWVGRTLIGAYHIVAIIILLNMLIAMMTKSYEATSENEETEWKFHRTAMWIRFIRREFIRPPPMNLIPNPRSLYKLLCRARCWLMSSCHRRRPSTTAVGMTNSKATAHVDLDLAKSKIKENLKTQQRSVQIMKKLVRRYKFNNLLSANVQI